MTHPNHPPFYTFSFAFVVVKGSDIGTSNLTRMLIKQVRAYEWQLTNHQKGGLDLRCPFCLAHLWTLKNFATAGRPSSSAVNTAHRQSSFVEWRRLTTVDAIHWPCTYVQTTDSRRSVLTTPGDDGGRVQVLSTVDDDLHPLITLYVQRDWAIGRDGGALSLSVI